jgi:quinol monooxygenase YgiN
MKVNKVITFLEAEVLEGKWESLQEAYRGLTKSGAKTPGLMRSYLIQSKDTPSFWRIVTIWESMEVLNKMRATVKTPGGVLVFREAGAEPKLSIFESKEEIVV